MSKGSLRLTDPLQWIELQDELAGTQAKNVFIFLADAPDEMSDKMEAKLFKDKLTNFRKTTKKNIWVFFYGKENRSYMERGVKYISACGYDIKDLSSKTINTAFYYQVTVKANSLTYELKPMNK
jgi:hypothetical protein